MRWTRGLVPLHRALRHFRRAPALRFLTFGFEKASCRVRGEPVPWNADAALVEALVEWAGEPTGSPAEFDLHTLEEAPSAPTILERRRGNVYYLLFRLAHASQGRQAVLRWRARPLGAVTLPHVSRAEFLGGLRLDAPTVFARLGGGHVACRSLVQGQGGALGASGLLQSPTSLLPLLDRDLTPELTVAAAGRRWSLPLRPTAAQLRGRQALLLASPAVPLDQPGQWSLTWTVEGRLLAQVAAQADCGAPSRRPRLSRLVEPDGRQRLRAGARPTSEARNAGRLPD